MAGNTASNFMSSITGNAQKAILIIQRPPAAESGHTVDVKAATAAAMKNSAFGVKIGSSDSAAGKQLKVQYNPTSLVVQSNAESIPFSPLLKNADSNVPTQDTRPPSIALSVQLLFDDLNKSDAFMFEKVGMTVGGMITGVAALTNTIRGKHYSVQAQTNGLLALLMRSETQLVTFQWAEMSFTGTVTQAGAKYIMFSQSGRPIRSMVQLTLNQEISTKADRTIWNKLFDERFKDSLGGSGGDKSTTDKMGNLLNIPGF